jgi:hypothetical protein
VPDWDWSIGNTLASIAVFLVTGGIVQLFKMNRKVTDTASTSKEQQTQIDGLVIATRTLTESVKANLETSIAAAHISTLADQRQSDQIAQLIELNKTCYQNHIKHYEATKDLEITLAGIQGRMTTAGH